MTFERPREGFGDLPCRVQLDQVRRSLELTQWEQGAVILVTTELIRGRRSNRVCTPF